MFTKFALMNITNFKNCISSFPKLIRLQKLPGPGPYGPMSQDKAFYNFIQIRIRLKPKCQGQENGARDNVSYNFSNNHQICM